MQHPAIDLAELGYKVFPCAGKNPLTANGFYAGTTDTAQIEAWLTKWPNCNWAIWTEGLLVVDVDRLNDGSANPWPADPTQAVDLLAAPTSITPSGGRHCIFRQPDGVSCPSTVKKLADCVDTRGVGGYIVVPPSINGGKPYTWLSPLEVGPDQLPLPPDWILEKLLEQPRAKSNAPAVANKIPAGNRNAALTSMAGRLRRAGHSAEEIYALLSEVNAGRCQPPMDAEELRTIAKSVSRYAPDAKDKAINEGWHNGEGESRPILINLADVTPKPIEWLWPNRIPLGKITIIAGEPGQGKSTMVSDIAARVTTGKPWPDNAPNDSAGQVVLATPASVILLSAEDDVEDTILPRMLAAEAQVSNVNALQGVAFADANKQRERCFNLETDLEQLERAIQSASNCRLIVLDPVSSFAGKSDSNRSTEVRTMVDPLAKLASQYGVAVVLVTHLSKGQTGQRRRAMNAPSGSIAYVAAARAAWLVAADRDNAERRLFLPIKMNLVKDPGGLAFRIGSRVVAGESVGCVEWQAGKIDTSADDALDDRPDREVPKVDQCCIFLRALLADGPKPQEDAMAACEAEGYSEITVKRAKPKAGVKSLKVGYQGRWQWIIPKFDPEGGQEDQTTLSI